MNEDKKQPPEEQNPATIICIWCYTRLAFKDIKAHPCTQPDFLDSDKVKYAKMIHPAHQHEWAKRGDWSQDWKYPPHTQMPGDGMERLPWASRWENEEPNEEDDY